MIILYAIPDNWKEKHFEDKLILNKNIYTENLSCNILSHNSEVGGSWFFLSVPYYTEH